MRLKSFAAFLLCLAVAGCDFVEAVFDGLGSYRLEARQGPLALYAYLPEQGRETPRLRAINIGPDHGALSRWHSDPLVFGGSSETFLHSLIPAPDAAFLAIEHRLSINGRIGGNCIEADCAVQILDLDTGAILLELTDNGLGTRADQICARDLPEGLRARFEAPLTPDDLGFLGAYRFELRRQMPSDEALSILGWRDAQTLAVAYTRTDAVHVVNPDRGIDDPISLYGVDANDALVPLQDVVLISLRENIAQVDGCLDTPPVLAALPVPDLPVSTRTDAEEQTTFIAEGRPLVVPLTDQPFSEPASVIHVIGAFAPAF